MKKKLLLIVVIALAIVGAGVGSALHYKNYQNKQNAENAKIAQAEDEKVRQKDAQVKAREAELVQKANALRVECEKGKAAYDKLTTFVQRSTPAPNCAQVVL